MCVPVCFPVGQCVCVEFQQRQTGETRYKRENNTQKQSFQPVSDFLIKRFSDGAGL